MRRPAAAAVSALAVLAALGGSGCGSDPSGRAMTEIEKRAKAKQREIRAGEKALKDKVRRERRRLRREAERLESGAATETATEPTTTPAPNTTGGTGGAVAP